MPSLIIKWILLVFFVSKSRTLRIYYEDGDYAKPNRGPIQSKRVIPPTSKIAIPTRRAGAAPTRLHYAPRPAPTQREDTELGGEEEDEEDDEQDEGRFTGGTRTVIPGIGTIRIMHTPVPLNPGSNRPLSLSRPFPANGTQSRSLISSAPTTTVGGVMKLPANNNNNRFSSTAITADSTTIPTSTFDFSPTDSPTSSPRKAATASPSAAIIGSIIGAVVVIIVGITAFMLIRNKKKNNKNQQQKIALHQSFQPDPFGMGVSSAAGAAAGMEGFNTSHQQELLSQPRATFDHYNVAPISPSNQEAIYLHQQQQQQNNALLASAGLDNPYPSLFTVVATYTPTLSDELELRLGDQVELLLEYDDGWCQGVNVTRGDHKKGVFPRHCIEEPHPEHTQHQGSLSSNNSFYDPHHLRDNTEIARSKRQSSMLYPHS